jgi:hypothetical protein
MAGGYGVDPSAIQGVGKTYTTEGDALVQLQSKAETSIGSGQVGKHYASVAAPYQQAFQQFGQILASMGNKVVETGGSLNSTASAYTQSDSQNAENLGSTA